MRGSRVPAAEIQTGPDQPVCVVETSGLEPPTPCVQTRMTRIHTDADKRKVLVKRGVVEAANRPGWLRMFYRCSISWIESQLHDVRPLRTPLGCCLPP